MPKKASKLERINIRVTPMQKRILEGQAKKEHKTLSKYLIDLGINKAIESNT